MRATPDHGRQLASMARDFNHSLLPKKAKQIIEISAEFLSDLINRVEHLETELEKCREQTTTESR